MKKILKSFKNLKQNKKGYMSLYTILWLSVFLPFLFFMFIYFTLMVKQIINYKNLCDNAASSAVTYLQEELIPDGIIKIRESDAKRIAKEVIVNNLYLNDDFTINNNSKIHKNPIITIEVYNNIPTSGLIINKFNKQIKLTKPSVVVTGEFPTHSPAIIKSIGVAQVQFDETP